MQTDETTVTKTRCVNDRELTEKDSWFRMLEFFKETSDQITGLFKRKHCDLSSKWPLDVYRSDKKDSHLSFALRGTCHSCHGDTNHADR